MKGIDVSNWQESMSFTDYDFVIMKATEGTKFIDRMKDVHLDNCQRCGVECIGFYHYARPDYGNSPEEEAEFFLSNIREQIRNCIMVLDWEQDALNYSTDWALRWLRHVHQITGIKPLIYIQASQEWTGNYNSIIEEDYGLWVAHWGVDSPRVENWNVWALWQYTDSPYDLNFFNGDKIAWKKYCHSNKVNSLCVGNIVKVNSRYDYNDTVLDDWVLDAKFKVMEIQGDRIVLGDGINVTGAWKKINVVD